MPARAGGRNTAQPHRLSWLPAGALAVGRKQCMIPVFMYKKYTFNSIHQKVACKVIFVTMSIKIQGAGCGPAGRGGGGMEGHYIRSCGPRGPVPPHRTVPPAGRSAVQDDVQDITMPARAAAPPLPGNRPIKQEGRRGALLRCVEINDNNKYNNFI